MFRNDTPEELATQLSEIVAGIDPDQIPLSPRKHLFATMKAYSESGETLMGLSLYLLTAIAGAGELGAAFVLLDQLAETIANNEIAQRD